MDLCCPGKSTSNLIVCLCYACVCTYIAFLFMELFFLGLKEGVKKAMTSIMDASYNLDHTRLGGNIIVPYILFTIQLS